MSCESFSECVIVIIMSSKENQQNQTSVSAKTPTTEKSESKTDGKPSDVLGNLI